MICHLRPLYEGRPALRRFLTTLVVAASVGCSSSSETAFLDDTGGEPSSAPALSKNESACAPDVSGLVPAGIEPIQISCPGGYTQRATFAALPIAGRFTTLAELTDAFCVETKATTAPNIEPRRPSNEDVIDFEENDVVAYAFDARAGVEPALFERGAELWLRVTTTACTGEAPQLASVAFVVPKGTKVNEQKCSLRCE